MEQTQKMTRLEKRWVLYDRGQLGLHPADLHHPAHLLQRAGRAAGLTDAEYLAFWGTRPPL